MSAIVRNRQPPPEPGEGEVLEARAVRLRNVCLQQIAVHRGLRPLSEKDFIGLDVHVGLAAAVQWWETAQRAEKAGENESKTSGEEPLPARRTRIRVALILIVLLVLTLIFGLAH